MRTIAYIILGLILLADVITVRMIQKAIHKESHQEEEEKDGKDQRL